MRRAPIDPAQLRDEYLADLREIQAHVVTALTTATLAAAEEALDAIADIACDGHDDEEPE